MVYGIDDRPPLAEAVPLAGVASRHVTAISGVLLIAMGIVPKVGALFATLR